uniref:Putative secreted protein n=1 Tax=Anopheles darlingi TaxID=43151 RepID=A0A2M4D9W1_ANODA
MRRSSESVTRLTASSSLLLLVLGFFGSFVSGSGCLRSFLPYHHHRGQPLRRLTINSGSWTAADTARLLFPSFTYTQH